MSTGAGSFAYAQARLQARIGMRAGPADLQRARSTRDFTAFLQLVRSTPQARYVARLAPGMNPHELERRLRDEWQTAVEEVARWQPAAWQDTVRWLRWLPYLAALEKLARGGRAPAWTRMDPVLGRIVAMEPGTRAESLTGTPLQPLQAAMQAEGGIVAAWLQHWRSLWAANATAAAGLERIAREVETLDALLRAAPPSAASDEMQAALAQRLLRVFRRNPLSPAAAVAFLGLEALDLLALRGAVLMRAVLAPGAAA